MKLRRGASKSHGGTRRKPAALDAGGEWDEIPDGTSVQARLRRRAASSATFEELLETTAEEGVGRQVDLPPFQDAAIVLNVASGRCRVFDDGGARDSLVPPQIATRQKSMLAV